MGVCIVFYLKILKNKNIELDIKFDLLQTIKRVILREMLPFSWCTPKTSLKTLFSSL